MTYLRNLIPSALVNPATEAGLTNESTRPRTRRSSSRNVRLGGFLMELPRVLRCQESLLL